MEAARTAFRASHVDGAKSKEINKMVTEQKVF
jgi:hypothetical protein